MMIGIDSANLRTILDENEHLRGQVTMLQSTMTRMVEERRQERAKAAAEAARLRGELDTAWASGYGPGGVVRVGGAAI